jgi:hypothetical protein
MRKFSLLVAAFCLVPAGGVAAQQRPRTKTYKIGAILARRPASYGTVMIRDQAGRRVINAKGGVNGIPLRR